MILVLKNGENFGQQDKLSTTVYNEQSYKSHLVIGKVHNQYNLAVLNFYNSLFYFFSCFNKLVVENEFLLNFGENMNNKFDPFSKKQKIPRF